MFRKIGDALRRFMAGRYGTDKLNQWLLGLAIVLIVRGKSSGQFGDFCNIINDFVRNLKRRLFVFHEYLTA